VNYYYANESRQPVGPFDAAQIRQFHRQGIIRDTSWVIEEGAAQWQPYAALFPPASREIPASVSAPAPLPARAKPLCCPKCFKTDIQRPSSKVVFAVWVVAFLLWPSILNRVFFVLLLSIIPMRAMTLETINSIVLILLFYAVYKTWPRRNRCKACGHRWKR
jgi:hypothetical protein